MFQITLRCNHCVCLEFHTSLSSRHLVFLEQAKPGTSILYDVMSQCELYSKARPAMKSVKKDATAKSVPVPQPPLPPGRQTVQTRRFHPRGPPPCPPRPTPPTTTTPVPPPYEDVKSEDEQEEAPDHGQAGEQNHEPDVWDKALVLNSDQMARALTRFNPRWVQESTREDVEEFVNVTASCAGLAAQEHVREYLQLIFRLRVPSTAGVASEFQSVPERNAEVPDGRLEDAPVRELVIPCDSCKKPSIPGKKGWMKQNGKPWTKLCSGCKKGLIDRAPTAICADDPACTWWRPEWETD